MKKPCKPSPLQPTTQPPQPHKSQHQIQPTLPTIQPLIAPQISRLNKTLFTSPSSYTQTLRACANCRVSLGFARDSYGCRASSSKFPPLIHNKYTAAASSFWEERKKRDIAHLARASVQLPCTHARAHRTRRRPFAGFLRGRGREELGNIACMVIQIEGKSSCGCCWRGEEDEVAQGLEEYWRMNGRGFGW